MMFDPPTIGAIVLSWGILFMSVFVFTPGLVCNLVFFDAARNLTFRTAASLAAFLSRIRTLSRQSLSNCYAHGV